MKKSQGFGVFIAILIAALASVMVVISLWFPIKWVHQGPPECCDMPSGGTYVGFPFEIKGEACCGISGTPLTYTNYMHAAYNFIIYFIILTIITLVFEKIQSNKKPRPIDHSHFRD